ASASTIDPADTAFPRALHRFARYDARRTPPTCEGMFAGGYGLLVAYIVRKPMTTAATARRPQPTLGATRSASAVYTTMLGASCAPPIWTTPPRTCATYVRARNTTINTSCPEPVLFDMCPSTSLGLPAPPHDSTDPFEYPYGPAMRFRLG